MEITRKDEATSRTETQRYRGAQRIYSTNILWQIPLLLLTITIASAGTENTEPAASQPFPQREGLHLYESSNPRSPATPLCRELGSSSRCSGHSRNSELSQESANNTEVSQ